jgi:hypothetical protein
MDLYTGGQPYVYSTPSVEEVFMKCFYEVLCSGMFVVDVPKLAPDNGLVLSTGDMRIRYRGIEPSISVASISVAN